MIDLHTHSSKSDGILRPQALVSRAYDNGVRVLALTDHDTVAGLSEAREEAERLGVRLISGIEFSSQWQGRGIHIVGLNFDPDHPVMEMAVKTQQRAREQRTDFIVEHLERRGIQGSREGAAAFANGGNICRPHFARFLVEIGVVPSVKAAFQHYLRDSRLGSVNRHWADMSQVVDWVGQAGGVSVLAHPEKYKLTRTKLRQLLQSFRDAGGDAVEVCSGRQDAKSVAEYLTLAAEMQLLGSAGSDFHDPEHSWQDVGKATPIPDGAAMVWSSWL